MTDIHNTQAKLQSSINSLEQNSDFSQKEIEAVKDFKTHLEAEVIGNAKIQKYISSLNTLSHQISDLLDPDKKEMKVLVGKINNDNINEREYSPHTIKEFKVTLNKFYQYHNGEEQPELLDFMSAKLKESEKPLTSPSELLQAEDIKNMIQSLQKPRDKALVFLAWDTGGRIGELLNVKWKDVTFLEKGAKIRFRESKSKKREIPIYESVEHLREWKRETAFDSAEDYVFINNSKRGINAEHYGNQMGYRSRRKVFENASEFVDSSLKTNPHAFRKARATYLASKGWNAAQLCEYFGWSSFSTAKAYIRMADKDLDSAMKKTMGIEDAEEENKIDLRPAKCGNCGQINPATRDYCKECEHLISKEKELMRESIKNKEKDKVKTEVIKSLTKDFDLSEKKVEEKIQEKTRERMEKRGFL